MSDFHAQKYKDNSTWVQDPVYSLHSNVTSKLKNNNFKAKNCAEDPQKCQEIQKS